MDSIHEAWVFGVVVCIFILSSAYEVLIRGFPRQVSPSFYLDGGEIKTLLSISKHPELRGH